MAYKRVKSYGAHWSAFKTIKSWGMETYPNRPFYVPHHCRFVKDCGLIGSLMDDFTQWISLKIIINLTGLQKRIGVL